MLSNWHLFSALTRCALSCLVVIAFEFPMYGADAEARSFEAAKAALYDGFYAKAERDFASFILKHPSSPRVPQAFLELSKAALKQGKFQVAEEVLATNMSVAGSLADRFQVGLAQVQFEAGKLENAASIYAAVVARFTNSPMRREAVLGEAQARFALKQWRNVANLLANDMGVFQLAAKENPASDEVVRGRLLLMEAWLNTGGYAEVERVAGQFSEIGLSTENRWRREFLLTEAQYHQQRMSAALASASNLVQIATGARRTDLEVASYSMLGEVLESLGRLDEAIAIYQLNQRPGVSAERLRQAFFKTVELRMAQGQITNAQIQLQLFLNQYTNEVGSDLALLTAAELRLKQYQALTREGSLASPTNLLTESLSDCARLLKQFTNSPFLAKAHYVRGWALLLMGNSGESLASFRQASDNLALSEEQAVARLKVADLEFQIPGLLTNAIRSYRQVVVGYLGLPRVRAELIPRARYQMLQASIMAGDLNAANEAAEGVMREDRLEEKQERSLLLYGKALSELWSPSAARQVFSNFVLRLPASSLRPEVELELARTYEQENRWGEAATQYLGWINQYPTNRLLRPRAEFYLAMADWQSGQESNALIRFTNFLGQFPGHELAQRAQYWAGDYFFRVEKFEDAERNYQRVYENTNWPVSGVSWQARLNAGISALLRPSFDDAIDHFTNLINRAGCPEGVRVQALFAYSDSVVLRPSTNSLEKYVRALAICSQIPQYHKEDPMVPMALGRMADWNYQLGSNDPTNYPQALSLALTLYQQVTNQPSTTVSARNQALIGIGNIRRQQAAIAQAGGLIEEALGLKELALDAYAGVLTSAQTDLNVDLFWLKEATLAAGQVCESLERWDQAWKIYLRTTDLFPSLKELFQRKAERAQQMEFRRR